MITTITVYTQCTNDDYNNNHTHKAQMMITTTIKYTKTHKCWLCKSDGEKMSFQGTLKVGSESLCIRSNGRSSHVAGPW